MKRLRIAFLFVLLFSAVPAIPAAADDPGPLPPEIIEVVLHQSPYGELIAYGSIEGSDKQSIIRQIDANWNQQQPDRFATKSTTSTDQLPGAQQGLDKNYTYSGYKRQTLLNSYVSTSFRHSVFFEPKPCSSLCGHRATISGRTQTAWHGMVPYFSDTIHMQESWEFIAPKATISISYPPSAGFSSGGKTAHFDSGIVNTAGWGWRLINSFDGVQATNFFYIHGVIDRTSGSHRIGDQIGTAYVYKRFVWLGK